MFFNTDKFILPVHSRIRPIWLRLSSSQVGRRVVSGSFWSILGHAATRLFSIIATYIIARKIGQVAFGQYGMIQSTIGLFGIFAGFGLGLTGAKHVAEFRTSNPRQAGRMIAFTLQAALLTITPVTVVFFLLSGAIAAHIFNEPGLSLTLKLSAPILFFQTLTVAQTGILTGLEAFRKMFRINLYGGGISALLLVVGAIIGGLSGVLIGGSLGFVLISLMNTWTYHSESRRFRIPISRQPILHKEIGLLWRFSLPASLSNLSIVAAMWGANIILVRSAQGYHEMAILTAASQWFNAIVLLPNLLRQVIMPAVSERIGVKATNDTRFLWYSSIASTAAIAVPAVIILSFFSGFIMRGYGAGFVGHEGTLVLMLLSGLLYSVLNAVTLILIVRNRIWLLCFLNLGWALVFIAASAIFVSYGAWGLALARFVSFVVHTLWICIWSWREWRAYTAEAVDKISANSSSPPVPDLNIQN